MKKIFFPILALSFAGIGIFSSCKKPRLNEPPVVNAGADQFVILPTDSVELSGSGSDPDGIIAGYKWTKISGPSSGTILNPDAATTEVKNLVEGTYLFELRVTDNGGLSATDKVVVYVRPPWSPTIRSMGKYQSKQSGRWRDASIWKRYDGVSWIDAMEPPTGDTVQVNILAGHIITVDSTAEVGKITIDTLGALTIVSDFTLFDELTNNGTLDWQDGTIKMLAGYATITLINNGNFLIKGNNGTESYWWDSEVWIVNNGIISKSSTGTTSLVAAFSFMNSSKGIIQGLGILSPSVSTSWISGGIIAPGLPIGMLTIKNVLNPFSSGSVLQVQVLDNSGPGTGHDQLVFNSDITLAGKLAVTEVGSSVGKGRFTIITTTGLIKDKFSSVDMPPGYSLQINGSSVELVKQ